MSFLLSWFWAKAPLEDPPTRPAIDPIASPTASSTSTPPTPHPSPTPVSIAGPGTIDTITSPTASSTPPTPHPSPEIGVATPDPSPSMNEAPAAEARGNSEPRLSTDAPWGRPQFANLTDRCWRKCEQHGVQFYDSTELLYHRHAVWLGEGETKVAFQAQFLQPYRSHEHTFCVKFAKAYAGSNPVHLVDEATVGQVACLMFYDMCERLGLDKYAVLRPVAVELPFRVEGKKLVWGPKQWALVEHVIPGRYRKFQGQFGTDCAGDQEFEIASTFSHFSLVWSDGVLIFADAQGGHDGERTFFTDLCVHTEAGHATPLDHGQAGMDRVKQNHTCTRWCRALGLPPNLDARLNLGPLPPVARDFSQRYSSRRK